MKKIAIIGAGITGLSAAQMLKDDFEVTVYEKDSIVGGLVKCEYVEGSLFHTCGGHVFNTRNQAVADWFWAFFSREDEFVNAERNSAVIFDNLAGAISYPIENHVYQLPEKLQKEVIGDFLAMAKSDDTAATNFSDFLKKRFGKTLYEIYFKPYNTKVWQRDLADVPLSWLAGKLPMPTVNEMLYNNFNHVKEKEFVHSTFWYERIGGSQMLCDRLAQGVDIRLGCEVTEISRKDDSWTVNGVAGYSAVLFCGNIKMLPSVLKMTGCEGIDRVTQPLEYHGTTAVFCEIDANPYSWLYLPSPEYQSHRIICTGNFSACNNSPSLPPRRITATVEFTGFVDDAQIRSSLQKMPLHPKYLTHKYNEYTYPVQLPATRGEIHDLRQALSRSKFYLAGRFAEWEYYNMDAAMGAAMDVCNKIKSEV